MFEEFRKNPHKAMLEKAVKRGNIREVVAHAKVLGLDEAQVRDYLNETVEFIQNDASHAELKAEVVNGMGTKLFARNRERTKNASLYGKQAVAQALEEFKKP